MPITSEVHNSILIKQIKVLDKQSPHHLKEVDILIDSGRIAQIGNIEAHDSYQIDGKDLCVSPGWLDYGITGGTPGLELIERKSSLIKAACAGGYTRIALWPTADPYIDHASSVAHVKGKDENSQLNIDVIGALSKSGSGEELSEILNMTDAGVIAISDAHDTIPGNNILRKSLQYCKPLNIPVIVKSVDRELRYGNYIHEGELSTRLGLKGDPAVGENTALKQQLDLQNYTEGNLLIHMISSETSLSVLRNNSENINCSVSVLHLCHDIHDLQEYNSLYKLEPPLRETTDKNALREGVVQGHIKSIVSDHRPRDLESWQVEYARAKPGQSTLELAYSICQSHADDQLTTEVIVDCLSYGNRAVLNLNTPSIVEGNTAELTLFNPEKRWTPRALYSDGKNSSYLGKELIGKVIGTIINNSVNKLEDE